MGPVARRRVVELSPPPFPVSNGLRRPHTRQGCTSRLSFFFPYESEEPDVCIDNGLQSRESFVGGAMPMYAESVGPFLPFQMAISTSNSHSEAHSCTLAQATRARALKTMISPPNSRVYTNDSETKENRPSPHIHEYVASYTVYTTNRGPRLLGIVPRSIAPKDIAALNSSSTSST